MEPQLAAPVDGRPAGALPPMSSPSPSPCLPRWQAGLQPVRGAAAGGWWWWCWWRGGVKRVGRVPPSPPPPPPPQPRDAPQEGPAEQAAGAAAAEAEAAAEAAAGEQPDVVVTYPGQPKKRVRTNSKEQRAAILEKQNLRRQGEAARILDKTATSAEFKRWERLA